MGRNVTDMGVSKKENVQELKKHAATIHCSNSLSLLQRKITNALLYHAYKELMLKDEHEITVKQLCRLIGYQGNNHSAIKEAFKGLISTVIEWNLIDDKTGSENWTASSILASVSLEGPLCYYAYSPRMKQLLHSPSMFGKIDLVIQSRFRSSYGLALYENCIRYRGLPQTKWFELDLFKKLMGVPAGKYDIFRDFKRRVLDKAVEEVNTYSDLVIESEVMKEGRKVLKVRFKLKERAKKTRLGKQNKINDEELKLTLTEEFSLSLEQIEQIFSDYDQEFIKEKITVILESKSWQEGKIQNVTGYLLSALKHNYQAAKNKSAAVIDLNDAKLEMELAESRRSIEEIRERYQVYREQVIHDAIFAMPQEEKKIFLENFYEFAEGDISTILKLQRKKYTRENVLDAPQIKAMLRQFALREIDLLNILSLEEFVVSLSEHQIEAWHKMKSADPDNELLRCND